MFRARLFGDLNELFTNETFFEPKRNEFNAFQSFCKVCGTNYKIYNILDNEKNLWGTRPP